MENAKKNIEALIEKATNADSPESAMKFSQAACNAANALCALGTALEKMGDK